MAQLKLYVHHDFIWKDFCIDRDGKIHMFTHMHVLKFPGQSARWITDEDFMTCKLAGDFDHLHFLKGGYNFWRR